MTAATVRAERDGDTDAIARVNRSAFGGATEAFLVDRLRERGQLVVSLVAESDDAIVGHIAFSPVAIDEAEASRGVGLGPMAVLPSMQRQGIGTLLVEEGLRRCRDARHDFAVVLGHPAYYPRFGFAPAARFGLRCAWDVPDGVFMVRELRPGALGSVGGIVRYQPEFDIAI